MGEDNFRPLPVSVLDSRLPPRFARGWQPAVDCQTASCPKDISLGWQTTARCRKKKDRFLLCSQTNDSWHLASKRGKRATLTRGSGWDPWWQKRLEQRAWPGAFHGFPSAIQLCPAPPVAGANEPVGSTGLLCALGPVLRPRSAVPRQPLASSSEPAAPGSPC